MLKRINNKSLELREGEIKEIQVDGKSLLIINFQGHYYAVSSRCTHLGCRLSKGKLNKNILTCPCHGSKFDITNGNLVEWITRWPKIVSRITAKLGLARSLKSYPVKMKGNDIFIDL